MLKWWLPARDWFWWQLYAECSYFSVGLNKREYYWSLFFFKASASIPLTIITVIQINHLNVLLHQSINKCIFIIHIVGCCVETKTDDVILFQCIFRGLIDVIICANITRIGCGTGKKIKSNSRSKKFQVAKQMQPNKCGWLTVSLTVTFCFSLSE